MKTNIYFLIIACSVLLRMRNVSNKCSKNQTHFMFITFFQKSYRFMR